MYHARERRANHNHDGTRRLFPLLPSLYARSSTFTVAAPCAGAQAVEAFGLDDNERVRERCQVANARARMAEENEGNRYRAGRYTPFRRRSCPPPLPSSFHTILQLIALQVFSQIGVSPQQPRWTWQARTGRSPKDERSSF